MRLPRMTGCHRTPLLVAPCNDITAKQAHANEESSNRMGQDVI